MAALAGKGQEVFVTAAFTLHAGKAVMQVAAIEVSINDLFQIVSPETVLPGEMLIIYLDEGFKMIFHAPVIIRRLRITGVINGGGSRQNTLVAVNKADLPARLVLSDVESLLPGRDFPHISQIWRRASGNQKSYPQGHTWHRCSSTAGYHTRQCPA